MKRTHKAVAGLVAGLGLVLSAAAFAHPGPMGGEMGHGGMGHAGMGHGGMGYGMRGGMSQGMGPGMTMRGGHQGAALGQQLMTPEERAAHQEKMRAAKTPEERRTLAEANFAEMQKRAKDKGITLPQSGGPGAGFGPHSGGHFGGPAR